MKGGECCSRAREEIKSLAFWRDIFAELVATFLLVAAQCALLLSYDDVNSARIGNALGMGFAVMAIGWCFEDFSGAHMNPAITLSLMLRMKVTFLRGMSVFVLKRCLIKGMAKIDKTKDLGVVIEKS
jgi:glycerol uptake facilitator-like aquaporin